MNLTTKKPSHNFNKTVESLEDRAYRVFLISKEQFKQLQYISIEYELSLFDMLNTQIAKILEKSNIKIPKEIKKQQLLEKSFAISLNLANDLKLKALENNTTTRVLISIVFNEIIKIYARK